MGVAKEGLDANGVVKPVVLGERGSVVEADGFTQRPWKFAELTGDGPIGQDSLSIARVQHDAEAVLSPRPSTSEGRSAIERRCLMKLAGLAPCASPAPAPEFVTLAAGGASSPSGRYDDR